jgi:hypothetical protein
MDVPRLGEVVAYMRWCLYTQCSSEMYCACDILNVLDASSTESKYCTGRASHMYESSSMRLP